jgi:hypothetical protein
MARTPPRERSPAGSKKALEFLRVCVDHARTEPRTRQARTGAPSGSAPRIDPLVAGHELRDDAATVRLVGAERRAAKPARRNLATTCEAQRIDAGAPPIPVGSRYPDSIQGAVSGAVSRARGGRGGLYAQTFEGHPRARAIAGAQQGSRFTNRTRVARTRQSHERSRAPAESRGVELGSPLPSIRCPSPLKLEPHAPRESSRRMWPHLCL